jgi:hypothetical protein
VSVEASNVIVFPTARIAGRLFYRSDAVADIRDGARIDGGVQRTARAEAPARVGGPRFRPFGGYHAFETFWLLVLGLLAVAVAREGTRDVVHRVACRFGASLLVGALVLMLAPAVGLLLFVTIVGIPLALAGFVVYAFSLYLGQIFAAGWLGAAIVRRAAPETPPAPFGEMAVGVLLLSILFLVPGVGWLVRAIAAVAGFGALWWVLYRRAVPPRESGAGVPPVAG